MSKVAYKLPRPSSVTGCSAQTRSVLRDCKLLPPNQAGLFLRVFPPHLYQTPTKLWFVVTVSSRVPGWGDIPLQGYITTDSTIS